MSGLYRRIRADIEGAIRGGAWPEGHRIPFEHELAACYGCSRATVSKAVSALAEAGLVERRRRAGTFVVAPRLHSAVLAVPDIAELVAGRGEAYRYQLHARRLRAARRDEPLAGQVIELTGVHHADGVPLAHEHRLIALDAVPEAATIDFGAVAPGSWLLRAAPWTRAAHRIAAVNPAADIAAEMGIAPAVACLQLDRTTWRDAVAVTFARQTFVGHRYDLAAEFAP